MRILILDTYYPKFLQTIYGQNPQSAQLPYKQQWRHLMDECFGTADFYSSNLAPLGHEAHELVVNCLSLQMQWAAEHGLRGESAEYWKLTKRRGWIPWMRKAVRPEWARRVLTEQIKDYRADVLYVQDMNGIDAEFLREMKSHCRLLVGQIACPLDTKQDSGVYDLILSSFPHYVTRFAEQGLKSAYFRIAFEPRVLQRLKSDKNPQNIASFVGGLSLDHGERLRFMEDVARRVDLHVWGYGKESLSDDSPLKRLHHGEAWALDMYRVLEQSALTLNNHIDVAQDNANNMRLYEATGVGTLLVTDAKKNLPDLFEPGKEVVTYRSVEECVELIRHYLAHPQEREKIAQAGQAHTLREHTYAHRMQELSEILTPLL